MTNLDPTTRKIVYEWLLTLTDGNEVILSEPQYEFYKEHSEDNTVFFRDVSFRPVYVVRAVKRPATGWLKNKYPCPACLSTGRKADSSDWCEQCGGSGVNMPPLS